MSDDKTVSECYQYNSDTRWMLQNLENRVVKEIEEIRDKLINRLPGWATFVISFLTMLVGAMFARATLH